MKQVFLIFWWFFKQDDKFFNGFDDVWIEIGHFDKEAYFCCYFGLCKSTKKETLGVIF